MPTSAFAWMISIRSSSSPRDRFAGQSFRGHVGRNHKGLQHHLVRLPRAPDYRTDRRQQQDDGGGDGQVADRLDARAKPFIAGQPDLLLKQPGVAGENVARGGLQRRLPAGGAESKLQRLEGFGWPYSRELFAGQLYGVASRRRSCALT
ncbi:hypothetical protein GCM10007859_03330 [Brevundimonas denitrificans]|uniref:Uncharacterized protein n=1 Tax=Brevundimonas denitrificans TaxID=1443434 RepID=A0ABQ6BE92_9CAUL|nr:hypothetical protein [Brevundimonas denitrificans]GLS00328.1 hypothetical protein GCM10007859_03330 [Brevundimonas denitrificans]